MTPSSARSRDDPQPRELTVSQLAGELSVTPRTIRYYEAQGLLTPRRIGRMRVFGEGERTRLERILRFKRLGLSLAEIREWLTFYALDRAEGRQRQRLLRRGRDQIRRLEQRLADIQRTLDELRAIERVASRRGRSGLQVAIGRRRDHINH